MVNTWDALIVQLVFSWNGLGNFIVGGTPSNWNPTFQINDTKLYVAVAISSTRENINLLKKLESGFKRTINWNKYLAKAANQAQNRYLDYLIDAGFQGVNRLFVLLFKHADDRESHKQHYRSTMEIESYNVLIEGRNFLINK